MTERFASPRVKIFCKHVGRGISGFGMIGEGDRILIGVSGGKDSLALSLALKLRQAWVPVRYALSALHIEWREHPLTAEQRDGLTRFFSELEIPYRSVQASIRPPSFHGRFSCYLCSRNRKRILFEHARDLGCGKVALGHTMDDAVETTLINLFYGGQFATMMPVQEFFEGRFEIIRPMIQVTEREIERLTASLALPVVPGSCPGPRTDRRALMKSIIRRVSRTNRRVRENIFRAPWSINFDYLPVSLESEPKLK